MSEPTDPIPLAQTSAADKAWADLGSFAARSADAAAKLQAAAAKLATGQEAAAWQARFDRFAADYAGRSFVNPQTLSLTHLNTPDDLRAHVEGGGKVPGGPSANWEGAADIKAQIADARKTAIDALGETVRTATYGMADLAKTWARSATAAARDATYKLAAPAAAPTRPAAPQATVADRVRAADRERAGGFSYGVRPPEARPGEKVAEMTERYAVRGPIERPEDRARKLADIERGRVPQRLRDEAEATGIATVAGKAASRDRQKKEAERNYESGLAFAGAVGKAAAALLVFGKTLSRVGESQVQNMRQYENASAAINAHMAVLDMQQTFREQRLGQKLAESTGNLTASVNRSRTASEPYKEFTGEYGNRLSEAATDVWTDLKEFFAPVVDAARYTLIKGKKEDAEKAGAIATAYDYAKDFERMSDEQEKRGRSRLDVVRGRDDRGKFPDWGGPGK